MALGQNYIKLVYGKQITFENAYIRIENITGDKYIINQNVVFYDETKSYEIDRKEYNFKPDLSDNAQNFIKQGYEYLKILPEFTSAVDLL